MRADHLEEATRIVNRLVVLDELRKLELNDKTGGYGALNIAAPGFDRTRHSAHQHAITRAAAWAALVVLRKEWDKEEANLRRRAVQIGLVLKERGNG